jgi:hypothetical protein
VLDCAVWREVGNSSSPERLQKDSGGDNKTIFGTCEATVSCRYKVCIGVEKEICQCTFVDDVAKEESSREGSV